MLVDLHSASYPERSPLSLYSYFWTTFRPLLKHAWLADGGQYSAAGTHPSCPDRYRGKAYIGNQVSIFSCSVLTFCFWL